MRQVTPILLALMAFSAFLASQIVFDRFGLRATLSSNREQKISLYQKNLKSFRDRSFNGKKIDLSTTKAPVIILNFWASWCVPCLEEFPSLVELKKKYDNDQVYVVGINSDTEDIEKNIKKTYKKYNLNFPTVLDKDKWTEKFEIKALPVSIIYLEDEVIISEGTRDFMDKKFLKKVERAIKKSEA